MRSSRRVVARWGRTTRSLLVGLVALAALAASGGTIYQRYLDRHKDPSQPDLPEIQQPTAPVAAATSDPDIPTIGISASRLAILRGGESGGRRPVVSLAEPTTTLGPAATDEVNGGVLARELVRQSVLIAARDELGLQTRDEVLGDAPPAAEKDDEVQVVAALRSGSESRALFVRRSGSRAGTLRNEALRGPEAQGELPRLATAAEALSRSGFVDALRELGLEGRRNAWRPDAGLPDGVEARLSGLGYAEPFSAIRDLHEAIRADGESPARLGALARGYALLGVLSEFHWHPAHKALKARGLLYAQRLVARVPGDPTGLWHRAFAEALTGLHRDALADLAEARTLAAARPEAKPPGWVDAIEAFARCDAPRLEQIKGPEARLAALLRLVSLEYPMIPGVSARAAKDVLDLDPECYRAIEAMCQVRGVSIMHVATAAGPEALDRIFPEKLRAIRRLPDAVRARLDHPTAGEPDLVHALGQAGAPGVDPGEPSWAALGHLASETRFLQVYWQLFFMRRLLAVPVDAFWREARPLVVDHRFRPYLDQYVSPSQEAGQGLAKLLLQDIGETKLDLNEIDLLREFSSRSRHGGGSRVWGVVTRSIDDVARDLAQLIAGSAPEGRTPAARRLLAASPHSPYARATLLEDDWDRSKGHLDEWKKESGDSPAFLAALARHSMKAQQVDEARDVLTRYIRLSPDFWAYEMLAQTFKARGDLRGWRSTLDEFLARGQDPGLDQAKARVMIADDLMGRGLWAEAWPYAEAAAATWAGWAMDSAARCAEGMGEPERAELWVRRQSERYPGSCWANWFLFCKRTGRGDAEAARDFAARYLEAIGADRDDGRAEEMGFFDWLSGDRARALAAFRKASESPDSKSPFACLGAVMVADDLGDAAARDRFVKALLTRYRDQAPKTARLWEMFRDALARGPKETPDVAAVDQVLQSIPEERRGNTQFIAAMYFKNHGKAGDARRYLEGCLKLPNMFPWMRAIAGEALRTLDRESRARSAEHRPTPCPILTSVPSSGPGRNPGFRLPGPRSG